MPFVSTWKQELFGSTETQANTPSDAPNTSPSSTPSEDPTNVPSESPSAFPSNEPSYAPSALPSNAPSEAPSNQPSKSPSTWPSKEPSDSPSALPTNEPSESPSALPTNEPSNSPSKSPSNAPSEAPSSRPSQSPSTLPTDRPSDAPSISPSNAPTEAPTVSPTTSLVPTTAPSAAPTASPTVTPLRVACAGDSLTLGRSGNSGASYPTLLQRLLGTGFGVRNYGRNAANAMDGFGIPYIGTHNFGFSMDLNPDIYLLMLGTNDMRFWKAASHRFTAGMKAIIKQVRAASPGVRIILAIPPWVQPNDFGISNDILLNDIQPRIREVAWAQQIELVDMYKPTVNQHDMYSSDNLHLNEKGYAALAQVWQRQILCNNNGVCDIGESCETCRQDCLQQCSVP
ncbi:unnamed protein product [Cylindrotheca closterium]|uniref:SGNH hydrolase-type esterase domain-containing protein n=1 Tax=Cylindrotheca closterium TaxID=2856 RepID=A0AAD2JGR6_9STRA|nr:unnamed protein product [Cylindrotheca closterium]